jgi:LPS export ABC transporter protein LptC
MTRQIQQIILFALLAISSYGVWKYYFDKETVTADKPFTKGYSVKNIEMKITDEFGKLTAKFKSPSLIRYTDSPIVFMYSPILWTFKDGKEHWVIKSNKAEYNADLNEVGMYDNLVAQTVNDSTETIFNADNMLLNLVTNQAHSTNGVTFKQQQFIMTGQDAQFDLKNEILEVNKNVKAIYKSHQNTYE